MANSYIYGQSNLRIIQVMTLALAWHFAIFANSRPVPLIDIWYSLSTENGIIFLLHVVVKRHMKPKGRGNAGMHIRKFKMQTFVLKPLDRFLQKFALMNISRITGLPVIYPLLLKGKVLPRSFWATA